MRRQRLALRAYTGFTPVDREYGKSGSEGQYKFSAASRTFVVDVQGRGVAQSAGLPDVSFRLPGDGGAEIILEDFAVIDGDILLVYYLEYPDGSAGELVRLDKDHFRVRWRRHISGSNIGKPFLYNGYVYLTCSGSIGKVDLRSGKYAWRYDDLNAQLGLNKFELPRMEKGKVIFTGEGVQQPLNVQPIIVEIDDASGSLLRAYNAATQESMAYSTAAARGALP
jgi:outer membrane protein assembly factor BamB